MRRGGALETVIDNHTGLFFDRTTTDSLVRAIVDFEDVEDSFDSAAIAEHARKFSRAEFKRRMVQVLQEYTDYGAEPAVEREVPLLAAASIPSPPLINAVVNVSTAD